MKRKFLVILHLFLGLSGLAGGIPMIIDPSGDMLQTPRILLQDLPIDNFLIPGLILTLILGILPLIISYGLIKRMPWAWKASLFVGGFLVFWTIGEMILWGFVLLIIVYFLTGLAILWITFDFIYHRVMPDENKQND